MIRESRLRATKGELEQAQVELEGKGRALAEVEARAQELSGEREELKGLVVGFEGKLMHFKTSIEALAKERDAAKGQWKAAEARCSKAQGQLRESGDKQQRAVLELQEAKAKALDVEQKLRAVLADSGGSVDC